jgi:hypothetical protein
MPLSAPLPVLRRCQACLSTPPWWDSIAPTPPQPGLAPLSRLAAGNWSRGRRSALALPPVVVGSLTAPTIAGNRPRVSPNLSQATHPPNSVRQSPPARSPWPLGATLLGLNSS